MTKVSFLIPCFLVADAFWCSDFSLKKKRLLNCFVLYYRYLDIQENCSTYDHDEWSTVVVHMILLIDCLHLLYAFEKYE